MFKERIPALMDTDLELVLVAGWAMPLSIWRPLVAELRKVANLTLVELPGLRAAQHGDSPHDDAEHLLDNWLSRLLAVSPAAPAVYVGWSLGGMLSTALLQRAPERVRGLVTLASNPSFCQREDWPCALPGDTLAAFQQALKDDVATTLQRFDALAARHGERGALRQLRQLRQQAPACDAMGLGEGLALLAHLDQRELLASSELPRVHVFGERDALVPAAAMDAVALHCDPASGQAVQQVPEASHLLPIEHPSAVLRILTDFCRALPDSSPIPRPAPTITSVDKTDVARSFSKAAAQYDSVAALQRAVGEQLLIHVPGVSEGVLLDLGCGTGYFRPHLTARCPGMHYLGLDIAEGMVGHARSLAVTSSAARVAGGESSLVMNAPPTLWSVGDAEDLPLASNSVALAFSSLAIQWCAYPERLFSELERVLRPRGVCVFATLGPETLCELRAAWAAVDGSQHVNTFLPAARLNVAAEQCQDLNLKLEETTFTMRYQRVRELIDELKTLGAHNMNRGRSQGLTGRRRLQGMLDAYEQYRCEQGTLPATYQVYYGIVKKNG